MDAVFNRRSIRKYKATPVEKEKIDAILRAAMYAPTAMNRRPWHFVVCDDREMINALHESHPSSGMLETAPVCIAVCCEIALGADGYWMQDCAAATQNILLSACELGLGTCWMGVASRQDREKAVASVLNLPSGVLPFCLIALGYPDEQKPMPDRFVPERVHNNKW